MKLWLVEVQVRLETMQSSLASHSALLVATEGAGRVELVVGVRPDHASAEFIRDFEDLRTLVGPHAAAQSIRSIVRFLDGLGDRAESLHRDHRAEDFFLDDAMTLRAIQEQRRSAEVAGRRNLAVGAPHLGAFVL